MLAIIVAPPPSALVPSELPQVGARKRRPRSAAGTIRSRAQGKLELSAETDTDYAKHNLLQTGSGKRPARAQSESVACAFLATSGWPPTGHRSEPDLRNTGS